MGSIESFLATMNGLNIDGLKAVADVYAYIGAEFVRISTSSPLGSVEGLGFLGAASLGMTLFGGSMVYAVA